VRTVIRVMGGFGAFGIGAAILYWILTQERAGTILLASFGVMPLIVVAWMLLRGAAVDASIARADDPQAEPRDGAGEIVGSFPTSTLWPAFLVLGVVVTGAGLVYGLLLVPVGIALAGVAILGLMRESRA